MSIAQKTARCQYCGETIQAGAVKCKHCHSVVPIPRKKPGLLDQLDTFKTGFIAGCFFTIILVILFYYNFWS